MTAKAAGWLRLAVSAGLMAILLGFMVDLKELGRHLADARWEYLAWLALWITLDRVAMAWKWRILLTCRGMELGLWPAVKAYYLASFAGCFLPSTVGADAMRVAAVSGPGRPWELVTASVVVERTLGFLAAALAAGGALLVLARLVEHIPIVLVDVSLATGAVVLAVVLVSFSTWLGGRLESLPQRLEGRGRLLVWLGKFLAAYSHYRHHRRTLAWFLLLSLAEQSAPVVGTWLTALAFDIPLSLVQALAVTPLALLFTRIPVSLSGFGVVEGLYVAFFGLVGLTPSQSFLLGLVANLSVLVATVPGAWFYAAGGLRVAKEDKAEP